MEFVAVFEQTLEHYVKLIPIEQFVFWGSLIEEIIAPIPSPLVQTLAGSALALKNEGWQSLIGIAIIGAFGKTIGMWFFYVLADKAEDFVLGRFGKLLGVHHDEIELLSKRFNKGRSDEVLLLILRAIPIIPSTPISLVSGFLEVPIFTFLWTSFIGSIIRNIVFLYVGYSGASAYHESISGLNRIESLIQIFLFAGSAVFVVGIYLYRKRTSLPPWLQNMFPKL